MRPLPGIQIGMERTRPAREGSMGLIVSQHLEADPEWNRNDGKAALPVDFQLTPFAGRSLVMKDFKCLRSLRSRFESDS
jgi:hypothetical protein